MLVEKPDEKSMREACEHYKLTEQSPENGFSVFKNSDDAIIRFKSDETAPVVEVVTNEKGSSVKKILEKAGYRKTSKGYVKGSEFANRQTLCTIKSSPTTLTFTKVRVKP